MKITGTLRDTPTRQPRWPTHDPDAPAAEARRALRHTTPPDLATLARILAALKRL